MNNIFFLQASNVEDTSGMLNIAFLVAIFVIFYFFMIRPQNKKRKELQNIEDKKIKESIEMIKALKET